MKQFTRFNRSLILGLGLLFLVACTMVQASLSDVVTDSFEVKPGGTLSIESERGAIIVTAHDKNSVDVRVIRKARVSSQSKADEVFRSFNIDMKQKGDNVVITGTKKESGLGLFGGDSRLDIRYEVKVPATYNADLETSGGTIDVGDLDGKVRARTAGGSLQFGNITGSILGETSGGSIEAESCGGDVDVQTAGGSIRVSDVSGDVKARTAGGSIRVGEVAGAAKVQTSGGSIRIDGVRRAVDARTSGGSIHVQLSGQPESDCTLETSAGSVTVTLPENINLHVKARTLGGKVHTDLPISVQGELSQSQIEGTLNNGGPTLNMETMGGNIAIHKGRETL